MVVPSPQWVHDLTEERGWKFLDQIRAEIATRSRSNASDVEKDHESHGNVHAVPATTLILSPDQQEDSQLWLAMHSLLHTAGHLSFSLRGALLLWLSSAFDLSYKGIQVRGTTEAITAWCQYAAPQVSDPDMSIYYRLIDCTRGLPEMSVSHLHATTKILLKRTQRRTIHPPHHSCFKTPALPLPVAQCGLQIHATPWMELLSATYLCLLEAQRSQNLQSDSEKNDPRAVQQMRESIETVNTLLNAFGKQLLGYNCNVGSGYSFVVKQDDAWVQVSDETAKRRQRAYFCTNSEHVLCASPMCGTTVGASSSRIQSIGYPELSESTKRFGSRESVLCAVQKEMVKDKRTYIQTVIDEIHFVQDNQFIDPMLGDPIDLDIHLSTRLPYRRFQLMRALLTAPSPTVLNAVAQNGRLFQPPTPQTSSKHELQELEQFLLNLENETKENVQ